MNFFEHQDQARRSTSRRVALFCLAIVLLIGGLYLAVVAIVAIYVTKSDLAEIAWWKPELFLLVSLGSVLLIGGASAYRMYSLRSGGATLAESLGGRPAEAHSDDPATRRLLNVVEEMALASGTPVPRVFVLQGEEGINAFAAGHDLGDAVIAVTAGALRELDREQLQGVVAHELSHVVNGDMRLNLRLIGVLHGILLLGSIGVQLLRATTRGRRSRSSKGSSGVAILLALGLALVVIGYTGVLVGRLIKSAVSRQREFLADASAVQFTRNPRGLSGALQKIRDSVNGSRIAIAGAEEASHLFFANFLGSGWRASLMASHPPLPERIARLEPAAMARPSSAATARTSSASARLPAASAAGQLAIDLNGVARLVGHPEPRHLESGKRLLQAIPPLLHRAAHELLGAVALVEALLIERDPTLRQRQLALLIERERPLVLHEVRRLLPEVDAVTTALRLPLAELAAPTLQRLSPAQKRHLERVLEGLAAADQRLGVFEFVLTKTVQRWIFGPRAATGQGQLSTLLPLAREAEIVLATLARAGHGGEPEVARAFAQGWRRLPELAGASVTSTVRAIDLLSLDVALDRLARATPRLKQSLLEAAAQVVLADGSVTRDEAELLRVVAEVLGCPVPPFAALSR